MTEGSVNVQPLIGEKIRAGTHWLKTAWFLARFVLIVGIFSPFFCVVLFLELFGIISIKLADWIEDNVLSYSDRLEDIFGITSDRKIKNKVAEAGLGDELLSRFLLSRQRG